MKIYQHASPENPSYEYVRLSACARDGYRLMTDPVDEYEELPDVYLRYHWIEIGECRFGIEEKEKLIEWMRCMADALAHETPTW